MVVVPENKYIHNTKPHAIFFITFHELLTSSVPELIGNYHYFIIREEKLR